MWLGLYSTKEIEIMEYIPLPPIKMETLQEKMIRVAQEALDTDVSPLNQAPKELSCAEGVSNLIKKVFPDFTITTGTSTLFTQLKNDKRFKATLTPSIGCVIVSPRIGDRAGHTGIFITNDRVASNDSKTGLWKGNYTFDSWIKTFKYSRNLHTYLFEIIN